VDLYRPPADAVVAHLVYGQMPDRLDRSGQGSAHLPVAAAEIGARSNRLIVAMDGEVVRLRSPLRYRIRAAGLRVYAPAPPEEISDALDRP